MQCHADFDAESIAGMRISKAETSRVVVLLRLAARLETPVSPSTRPHPRRPAEACAASWCADVASGKPSLRRMYIAGHQFVNADCNRFNPTNAVNQYHKGETQCPNATDSRMKNPAISRRPR